MALKLSSAGIHIPHPDYTGNPETAPPGRSLVTRTGRFFDVLLTGQVTVSMPHQGGQFSTGSFTINFPQTYSFVPVFTWVYRIESGISVPSEEEDRVYYPGWVRRPQQMDFDPSVYADRAVVTWLHSSASGVSATFFYTLFDLEIV